MNFLNLTKKFKIFFLLCFIPVLQTLIIIAGTGVDGVIASTHYISAGSYFDDSIILDEKGIIIIGRKDTICIFNGSRWDHIPVKGNILFSRNIAGDVMFSDETGVGYISFDSSGKFSFAAVRDNSVADVSRVKEITSIGNTFFLRTGNCLLSYKNGLKLLDSSFGTGKLYRGHNNLICVAENGSIKTYTEDLVSDNYSPGIKGITRIAQVKDGYLVFCNDNYLISTDLSFSIKSKTLIPVNDFNLIGGSLMPDKAEGMPFINYVPEHWSGREDYPVLDLRGLNEGNYRLRIKKKEVDGVNDELVLRILKPFYQSRFAILLYILSALLLLFIVYKSRKYKINRKGLIITGEEDGPSLVVSDVQNPSSINKPKDRWDKFEMVTVLFSDIQGFSKIAESMNPEVLIDELDKFFFHFDSVVEKYNIEKIKTIGDAYMAAGGLPHDNVCNPVEVVLAALEMQQFMEDLKTSRAEIWDLRIGIHSGPVIAGVIGYKKRSYDIWGDTVNTASRMESSGEAGKINISGITYELVRDFFVCEYRGKLPVKYKGNIDMYFVKGIKPELAGVAGNLTNRTFFLKLQILRLADIEKVIFRKLECELPENKYFHNLEFARRQYEFAKLITKSEHLNPEENILVLTAALFLNTGQVFDGENEEIKAAEYARYALPEFKYSDEQITEISNLILSTRWPEEPQTLTEKIMRDVKTEYLCRNDLKSSYRELYREMSNGHKKWSHKDFINQILKLLKDQKFYTHSAMLLQEVDREEQIRRIREDEW